MSAAQRGRSEWPQDVSHLLVASDALGAERWEGNQVAVCGAVLETVPAVEDPRYCRACVRAAVSWNSRAQRSRCPRRRVRPGTPPMNATAEARWLASIRNDWLVLALCLVDEGGIAKSAGVYFNRGRPSPKHLIEVFDRLIWAGWVSVTAGDPIWAIRQMNLTQTGQNWYMQARQQHAGPATGPAYSTEITTGGLLSGGSLAGGEASAEGPVR